MFIVNQIEQVQQLLQKQSIDGWLIYGFSDQNSLGNELLHITQEMHITRRFFYWIPSQGIPVKIYHKIEEKALAHCIGENLEYFSWKELHQNLKQVLKGTLTIAMEYSHQNAIPYVSRVDAGMVELVQSMGAKVVSSASFLQELTCKWDKNHWKSHLDAEKTLLSCMDEAWGLISNALTTNQTITEYDVQQTIFERMQKEACVTEGMPICAVNDHAAMPHYSPEKKGSKVIQKGDLILIDLWAKKKQEQAVFADYTVMAVADSRPTARQEEIFSIVREAQKKAIQFLEMRLAEKRVILGFEVDEVARNVISKKGYGQYFTHRLGHNIHTTTHGPGAQLDSLETLDDRALMACSCFSIEPGIYIPGEIGVRLELNAFISEDGRLHITGRPQDTIQTLL